MVSAWMRSGFSLAVPGMERELNLAVASIGAAFTLFAFSYAVFQPFAGFAMVRFGSRGIAGLGLLLATVGAIWTSMATNLVSLEFSWILVGAGLSTVLAARCATFAALPERRRGLMNGAFEFCPNAALLLLPALTAVEGATWRMPLRVSAIAALTMAVLWVSIARHSAVGRGTAAGRS
jgi:sugar phosphate permease